MGQAVARGGGRVRVKHSRGAIAIVRSHSMPAAVSREREQLFWLLSDNLAREIDTSSHGLQLLLGRFVSATAGTASAAIDAHCFWRVLSQAGVRDTMLAQRIFTGLGEAGRLDYRALLYGLLVRGTEPVQPKLELLFRLYDLDGSGTFSLEEMTQIFLSAVPQEQQASVLQKTRQAWSRLLQLASQSSGLVIVAHDHELGLSDLIDACEDTEIEQFFDAILTKARPTDAHASPQSRRPGQAEVCSDNRGAMTRTSGLRLSASLPVLQTKVVRADSRLEGRDVLAQKLVAAFSLPRIKRFDDELRRCL